ncbi:hypothetical protein [cyanobacterium endosymbiont of Rhopalodia gibberula]|uniref:hypothetical protein n=1 Tax=cyanobacterium endosymbiont of Rhopalodia gibberula TaxID=1763363 RepID=UPI001559E0AC
MSIFGDHSDMIAIRRTGFVLLSSASVQDLAVIATAVSFEAQVFIKFLMGLELSIKCRKWSH